MERAQNEQRDAITPEEAEAIEAFLNGPGLVLEPGESVSVDPVEGTIIFTNRYPEPGDTTRGVAQTIVQRVKDKFGFDYDIMAHSPSSAGLRLLSTNRS